MSPLGHTCKGEQMSELIYVITGMCYLKEKERPVFTITNTGPHLSMTSSYKYLSPCWEDKNMQLNIWTPSHIYMTFKFAGKAVHSCALSFIRLSMSTVIQMYKMMFAVIQESYGDIPKYVWAYHAYSTSLQARAYVKRCRIIESDNLYQLWLMKALCIR